MIEISHLSFDYSGQVVLNDLSFVVEAKETVALVGLNGAGKTTLIKLLLDLLRSRHSDVLIDGISSWQKESRRQLNYLPEKFRLKSGDTALQYFRLLSGIYLKKLDHKYLHELCEQLGFNQDWLTRNSAELSKGNHQKIGIIGCFLFDIPLLILDEPLSGLDPKARHQIKALFKSPRGRDKTIFFSSHLLADVDELCDRMIVLNQGKIAFDGNPHLLRQEFRSQNLEQAFMNCIGNEAY